MEREKKVEQLREAFDYLYFGQCDLTEQQVAQVLKETGLEGFVERYLASQTAMGTAHSRKLLRDLTKLSFKVYENIDRLPLERELLYPENSGSYKFIATGISRPAEQALAEEFETNKIWLIAEENKSHQQIATAHGFKGSEVVGRINEIDIFGGGRLHVDHEKKELRADCSSGSFGSCSDELVAWLLEEFEAAGYNVTVSLDDQGAF